MTETPNSSAKADDSNTPPLELVDDVTGYVGSTRFGAIVADLLGRETPFSDETVRGWVRKGLLKVASTNGRGRLFNPAHAPAVAQNLPQPKHGGARRNAGRKKKHGTTDGAPLSQEMKKAAEAREALDAIKQRIDDEHDPDPDKAVHVSELLGFTRDELRAILAVFGTGHHGLSPAKVGLLKDLVELQYKEKRLAVENGELVKKSEIIDAVRKSHAPVVEMLDQLPSSLTNELAPRVWITDVQVDRLLSMVYATLERLGVDPKHPEAIAMLDTLRAELRRPESLMATMRAIIGTAVDSARRGLVEESMSH